MINELTAKQKKGITVTCELYAKSPNFIPQIIHFYTQGILKEAIESGLTEKDLKENIETLNFLNFLQKEMFPD